MAEWIRHWTCKPDVVSLKLGGGEDCLMKEGGCERWAVVILRQVERVNDAFQNLKKVNHNFEIFTVESGFSW